MDMLISVGTSHEVGKETRLVHSIQTLHVYLLSLYYEEGNRRGKGRKKKDEDDK